jgi:hypothetical protein
MANLNSSSTNDKKRRKRKHSLLRSSKYPSFAILSFAFTFISAWNGFQFYLSNFGLLMALIITTAFEIARFSCIFRFILAGSRKTGIVSISLYLITVSVCAFSSINSFNSDVIMKNQNTDQIVQNQISLIKESYAKKMAGEIEKAAKDIPNLENMTARYPNRSYWKIRLSQAIKKKENLMAERERFLGTVPEDPKKWIVIQANILELKLENLSEKNKKLTAVNTALKETWGLDQAKAQKLIGMGVTAMVELSIILLTMLAAVSKKPRNAGKKTFDIKGLMDRSAGGQGEETIENFIKTSQEHIRKTGKLPPLNKVTINLRPLIQFLRYLDPEFLRDLAQSQETEKSDP